MDFTELCENMDYTAKDIRKYLKNNNIDITKHYRDLNKLYILKNTIKIKTVCKHYENEPFDINHNNGRMFSVACYLKNFDLVCYLAELCTNTNYDPVIIKQETLNTICFNGLIEYLKYIINLSFTYPKYYRNIMKNIDINEMIECASTNNHTELINFLVKLCKKTKNGKYKYNIIVDENMNNDTLVLLKQIGVT